MEDADKCGDTKVRLARFYLFNMTVVISKATKSNILPAKKILTPWSYLIK